MRRKIAVILMLLVFSSFTACGSTEKAVTITYVKAPLNVPSVVEQEKGFFSDRFAPLHREVAYADLTSGSAQVQALESGDVQFLFAVGAPALLTAAASGAQVQILSAYCRAPEAYQIQTLDEGIRSAEDLRGKTIAGPKGSTLHELLCAYLATAGLGITDVEFLPMDIAAAQTALLSGQVSAALLAGPNAYKAEQEGCRVLTDGTGLIQGTVFTAAARTLCEKQPELVEAFLAAQADCIAFLESDREEALEITAAAVELPLEAVEAMYTQYDFQMTLLPEDLTGLAATADFLLEAGMLTEPVDTQSLIWQQADVG